MRDLSSWTDEQLDNILNTYTPDVLAQIQREKDRRHTSKSGYAPASELSDEILDDLLRYYERLKPKDETNIFRLNELRTEKERRIAARSREEVLSGIELEDLQAIVRHYHDRMSQSDDPAWIAHWNKKLTPAQTEIDRRAKEEGDRKLDETRGGAITADRIVPFAGFGRDAKLTDVLGDRDVEVGQITHYRAVPPVASVPIDTGVDLSEEDDDTTVSSPWTKKTLSRAMVEGAADSLISLVSGYSEEQLRIMREEERLGRQKLAAAARDLREKLEKSIAEDEAKKEKTIVSRLRRWWNK
jgi:hypothetical protein